ncbi:All-trans-phytoene synthase/15-cis-phytoene synthase [Pirellulimonas nuda]|uniref:All-trans-phytoene synthase/15-cis-phytoene synthase n=1 Tax=Pirellulimonas nuda TaxID=2528009 RepID=A0A518DGL4_9BACT|nr:squalene/phytoene synthase family protein [Pirellulimonas nuda]QDU90614.1 All-trans-phytoene synthase/15-cis-phytoene synthase [Pirellulimonas nuda]
MASLEHLLETTSRTFALAIPLLPEPLRREVTLGYLVFRIADTLEDAECLNRDQRIAGLEELQALLRDPSPADAERFARHWTALHPTTNPDYAGLLRQTGDVLGAVAQLEPAPREIIRRHARRSAAGMAATLRAAQPSGGFALRDIGQLKEYCYFVAGIVGEMLTELFCLRLAPSPARDALTGCAAAFGEGLQLVNILKDADCDADQGRRYLPVGVPMAALFALARRDLASARRYVDLLADADAPSGCIAFARLPMELALAALDRLETAGPGAKLSRQQVADILAGVTGALAPQVAAPQDAGG